MADHPNKLAFEEGARYIFNNWTALRLAVEQDWGGVESPEKKEWFIDVVIDYFAKQGKKLDVDDIEAVLSQVMSDEFHTTLEDDSPYLVAKHLYELFNQCIHGNHTEVERLREKAKSQNAYMGSSMGQGDDSDSGDENDDDQEEGGDDEPMEETPQEPLVDEDGWEIVRRK
ncbi:Pre-rRNA-processing protein TSR2-domain-containing protein [Choanephora cucurbitarum]|nr:Pre-rRNA-processing protein TSR2-domain-containing protein [Choanephora cucurbitarum]